MGTLGHGIAVSILMDNSQCFTEYYGIDNGEYATLNGKKDIFCGMKSLDEMSKRIFNGLKFSCKGFKNFAQFVSGLCWADFDDFLFQVRFYNPDRIEGIVLLCDIDRGYQREYSWAKYGLDGSFSSGTELDSALSAEDFIKNKIFCLVPAAKVAQPEIRAFERIKEKGVTFAEFDKLFEYKKEDAPVDFFGEVHPPRVAVSRYKGKDTELFIPAYVEGYEVKIFDLGDYPNLEKLHLESNSISVSTDVFTKCPKLMKADEYGFVNVGGRIYKYEGSATVVNIPEGVREIANKAFENCSGIQQVNLPASIEVIDFCAFKNCRALHSVNFPTGLKKIGYSAFEGCVSLGAVTFPQSLERIDGCAFMDCSELVILSIGENTLLDMDTFRGCEKNYREDGLLFVNSCVFGVDWAMHGEYMGFDEDKYMLSLPGDVKALLSTEAFMLFYSEVGLLSFTDNLRILPENYCVSGIECLRIVSHKSGETIFETDMFACCGELDCSNRFLTFCEMLEEGNIEGITETFANFEGDEDWEEEDTW